MKKSEKIVKMLEDAGFCDIRLFPARGYWTHRVADVCLWTARGKVRQYDGLPEGFGVEFMCWESMTLCARYGINIECDGCSWSFMVSPRWPGKS